MISIKDKPAFSAEFVNVSQALFLFLKLTLFLPIFNLLSIFKIIFSTERLKLKERAVNWGMLKKSLTMQAQKTL